MYGKYNSAEERAIDAPARKAKSEALKKKLEARKNTLLKGKGKDVAQINTHRILDL